MSKIFIGWDSREPIAADICEFSLNKHTDRFLDIQMLKQQDLRDRGIYERSPDPLSSTEFTFTRFLVPHLCNYQGWALFVDCDFLWLDNVHSLFELADDQYAVMVVKHDYRPQTSTKMDGQRQIYYPRKNWSSLMLINCAHPKNQQLTPELVNSASGQFLHRFQWLDDAEIGSLDLAWNWLVGWYHEPYDGKPKALHYTEGGPWFSNYEHCDYATAWLDCKREFVAAGVDHNEVGIDKLWLPDAYKNLLQNIIDQIEDPFELFGRQQTWNFDTEIKKLGHQVMGISEADDISKKARNKGAKWDNIVHALVQGATGCMASWDIAKDSSTPIVLRSIAKSKIMKRCLDEQRDFYYIDTGYFGNRKLKDYHRITKNAMQWLGPIESRPSDRFDRTQTKVKPMTEGSKILICPPSEKAMSYWGLNAQDWVDQVIKQLESHTDRPIKVRLKQPRELRATVNTMEQALMDDVHAMITYNSIAAVESLIYGKPVFTMGPNAAHRLANTDISQIEKPFRPTTDEVVALLRCLAYHQFTVEEMRNGFAWAVLQGHA